MKKKNDGQKERRGEGKPTRRCALFSRVCVGMQRRSPRSTRSDAVVRRVCQNATDRVLHEAHAPRGGPEWEARERDFSIRSILRSSDRP